MYSCISPATISFVITPHYNHPYFLFLKRQLDRSLNYRLILKLNSYILIPYVRSNNLKFVITMD
ncbi:hypothetical protein DDL28_02860 [Staphylococcus aureus]|uniref:Uncharacterized protein n=1 Tax=Staphylococcus aureus TaxID=1280 RepID=A0AAX2YMB1_STAAU|nr:hypothetical protein BSG38_14765 [Staphylococcus aureus]EJE56920.1 hypothetical protein Newbould305_0489 [Staphylococcus aureus subsp. aureus str. Newbould 305]EOR36742.1 hypothetical protein S091751_0178 [Staphylococcus aureus subsp. aureus 091751]EOR37390.1 hypothetical protein S103564_0265 [Staphylococcus aureus subsp. aureus 103564]KAA2225888.1 hypothetical protein F1583_02285 [Staphylococcus sp. 53017]KAA2227292.1 hypothetical protein F1590_13440 [Staphylococcus sp. 52717]KAA2249318.1